MARLAPELMPVIGTAYDSRLAFRLEITRICLSNSVWLSTVTSTPSVLVLRCMLGVEPSTPSYLCCSCTIRCTRKAGEQEWKVRQSDAQHACRLDKDPKFVRLAQARGARRLELLRREETEFGVQGRPFEEENSTEDEEEDQLDSSEEEATEVRRARRRSVAEESAALPATEGIAAVEDEDVLASALEQGAIEVSTPRKRARIAALRHPRLDCLQQEIDDLARCGPLEMPSATNGISAASHTELRILAGAAALQRGFELFLLGRHVDDQERASGKAFSMSCKLGSSRTKEEGRRLCGAYLKAELHQGRWSIVRSDLKHNHELQPPPATWLGPWAQSSIASAVASTSRQHLTPSFTANPSPQHPQNQRHYSLLAPPSCPSPYLGASSSLARRLDRLSSTPSVSNPPTPTPNPFLPNLKLFLASISPSSTTLVSAAHLLLANGLDSKGRLVLLLSLSETGVNEFTSLLAERGVPKIATLLLKKGVFEAKRSIRDQGALAVESVESSGIKIE